MKKMRLQSGDGISVEPFFESEIILGIEASRAMGKLSLVVLTVEETRQLINLLENAIKIQKNKRN